jgi:2-keto-4-pentenoate hydratase/2-oxohepta-3-ene-1,7-dioic acid hydratase in catechol pathway
MKLVTFRHNGHTHAGVVSGDKAISLKAAGFADMLAVIQGAREALGRVASFVQKAPAAAVFGLESVTLCAPIPKPPKILCMGLNYRDHAAEAKMEIPKVPVIFAKYGNTVIGPGDRIVLPKNSTKPDYEAELAFVIGKGGRHLRAENWREHVVGYMNANDVSARDFQMAVSQWTMGKNFDTFLPMGPWIVTADEIADPHQLGISTTVNGERLQNSNTCELIFRIPETIEFLSGVMTLEPGDVVLTGTPAGVGFSWKPPRWLKAGDEVAVEVERLGQLKNMCVAEC